MRDYLTPYLFPVIATEVASCWLVEAGENAIGDRSTDRPTPQAPRKSPTALMQVTRSPERVLGEKGIQNSILKIFARNFW